MIHGITLSNEKESLYVGFDGWVAGNQTTRAMIMREEKWLRREIIGKGDAQCNEVI